jgi:hypothetical protein
LSSKQQNSKRSKNAKTGAKWAGLRGHTAHPSHLRSTNYQSIKRYWKKVYGKDETSLNEIEKEKEGNYESV